MSKLKVMYNGHPFSPATNLTSSIGPTDTIIAVNDVSVFPPAPNVATINDGEGTGETIIYTAKTSNALSGCSRGVQGKAKSHSMGADIARYFTAYDYDTLRENINILNNDKVEKEVGKVLSDNNYTAAEKQKVATIKDKVDTTTFESFQASNTQALNGKVSKNQTANGSALGLVKADAKGTADNIPAKIGSDGKLYISSQAVLNAIPNADTVRFGGV